MFGIDVLVFWGFIVYFVIGAICGKKTNAEDDDTSVVVHTVSVSYQES